MPPKVSLKITKGKLSGKTFSDQKGSLILGRREDCNIVFPDDTVSRRHCLLDIDLSAVTVRDLGSRNGTYLNGKIIGCRDEDLSAEEAWEQACDKFSMKTGDCLKLGPDCEITLEIKQKAIEKPEKKPALMLREVMKDRDNILKIAGYRTIRLIGRGGMGAVWLVEEEETGKRMALKVMLPEKAADRRYRERFLREASLSGQLKHKNVVNQFKYGQSDGDTGFILMEYCPGESVVQLMTKKGDEPDGKLDRDLATHIILQTLDGLHYCHHAKVVATLRDGTVMTVNGVVHRDFKPGNILLSDHSSRPVAKVADFGLAKAFSIAGLSGITSREQIAGMMEFMPADQIKNFLGVKPEVDVWSAAACYYYMLTGTYPKDFRGKDAYSVALNDSAIPIRKRNTDIPERLAEIIDTALLEIPEGGISALELKTAIESVF
jgi:serine/threonine protein kinase